MIGYGLFYYILFTQMQLQMLTVLLIFLFVFYT